MYEAFFSGGTLKEGFSVPQIEYLYSYFDRNKDFLAASHMVIEEPYLSRSFLYDYTNYYAYTNKKYGKYCKRIHFFSCEDVFSDLTEFQVAFETSLYQKNEKTEGADFWEGYLGYVVARPILERPVGPMVVKHYPLDSKHGYRSFGAIKKYHVHIGGKHLIVDTLAMQSQDRNVSACATASIWSAFQKLSKSFKTHMPSPYEITHAAGLNSNLKGRSFPSNGLNITESVTAISKYGLVCDIIGKDFIEKKSNIFLGQIYAYIELGIPILLVLRFSDNDLHMVTLVGYRLDPSSERQEKNNTTTLYSEHINTIYAHDDNLGPFSELTIEDSSEIGDFKIKVLNKSWEKHPDIYKTKSATVDTLIIPLKSSIRINFGDIYGFVLSIDKFTQTFLFNTENEAALVWDIYLAYSSDYKETAFNAKKDEKLKRQTNKKIIDTPLPKYIWVVAAIKQEKNYVDNVRKDNFKPLFHLIIDPSGIRDAHNIIMMPIFDTFVRTSIKEQILSMTEGDLRSYDQKGESTFKGSLPFFQYIQKKFNKNKP